MHGPITNPGAHLGQTFGVGIRVGLCRAISSLYSVYNTISVKIIIPTLFEKKVGILWLSPPSVRLSVRPSWPLSPPTLKALEP